MFEVFVPILLIVNGVLLINPSANMFFIGDFTVHHKDWLTCSSGTDRSGELYYNFLLSQMTLFRWLTFLLMFLIVTLTILLFWFFLFLMTLLFVLQWLTLHRDILIMWLSRFLLTFGQTQDVMSSSIAYLWLFCWNSLRDHLRNVSWEGILKLSSSQFCEYFQDEIDVYIHRRKYQVKPHSFSWFSTACATAIVYRNHISVRINRIDIRNLN